MAASTPQQRKKRNLLLFTVAAVLITAAVIVFLLGGGVVQPGGEGEITLSSETQQRANNIRRSVSIPESFFEEGVLDEYESYNPVTAPANFGRENPFQQF